MLKKTDFFQDIFWGGGGEAKFSFVIRLCLLTDDNECLSEDVCGLAMCYNVPGSYNCQCTPGTNFDPRLMSCLGKTLIV